MRRVDLAGDGEKAHQPACSIECERHHSGMRVRRILPRHDVGAADWHQAARALAIPEQDRWWLRPGERPPSFRRSVVLVDVLEVRNVGRVSDNLVCWRFGVPEIPQHRVRLLGQGLWAALDLRQPYQADVAHERRKESQPAQHARKADGAHDGRQRAGFPGGRNQVG